MALSIDTNEIRRLYDLADENGDGRLTVNEMNRYLKRLGMDISEDDLKYLVIPKSETEDDSLTFNEFVGLCHSLLHDRSEDELSHGDGCDDLMEAFKVYDMNNDGFISSTELQQVLRNLGFVEAEELETCQKMISTYDLDSDGTGHLISLRLQIDYWDGPPLTFSKVSLLMPSCKKSCLICRERHRNSSNFNFLKPHRPNQVMSDGLQYYQ